VGGVFKHTDLQETECYLLDTGTTNPSEIYLWFGVQSTYQGRALALRVSQEYFRQLVSLNRTDNADSSSLLIADPTALHLITVESNHEPERFKDCFLYWNHSLHPTDTLPQPLCESFDPQGIGESDEAQDAEYDRSGRKIVDVVNTPPLPLLPISHPSLPHSQR
jgi:hypothetical protein